MTAMPAWGVSHDDATLWDMVAFLRAMPTMSAAQYEQLAQADEHDNEASHHVHGTTPVHEHGAPSAHHH